MRAGVSYYGVIFPEFWTGHTGRLLRAQGGKEAQVLALYLTTNRHANMIGFYSLLADDVRHETGLTGKAIARGFAITAATEFATFDAGSSVVWVRQMARFRLGLRAGAKLAADDNRVAACNRLYHGLPANPFLGDFFDLNHSLLRLSRRRENLGLVVPLMDTTTSRPLQGARKGLGRAL
jgi:hypothetical protein